MTDVLVGIRAVKLYSWERQFVRQISAVRRRETPTYMALPTTLPMYSEAGNLLCLEFTTTCVWGETVASKEWEDTLDLGLQVRQRSRLLVACAASTTPAVMLTTHGITSLASKL